MAGVCHCSTPEFPGPIKFKHFATPVSPKTDRRGWRRQIARLRFVRFPTNLMAPDGTVDELLLRGLMSVSVAARFADLYPVITRPDCAHFSTGNFAVFKVLGCSASFCILCERNWLLLCLWKVLLFFDISMLKVHTIWCVIVGLWLFSKKIEFM